MPPRISVIVPARNARDMLADCLLGLRRTIETMQLEPRCDFILIDDASDSETGVTALLTEFRSAMRAETTVLKTHNQQHYTRACALGLSLARGELVLLLSHDMVITPYYLSTLVEVAELDTDVGVIRGTADFVDAFPQHVVRPPLPLRNLDDIYAFSKLVASYNGLCSEEDSFLTGDAVLIKRSVLDRIGVMDPRFFGYFGDIDFGLRAQRAGFKLGCAKGAWLRHIGAGYYKSEAARLSSTYVEIHTARMNVVRAAYKEFRAKWDMSLPEDYRDLSQIDFSALRTIACEESEYVPPLAPDKLPAERV